ncbi:hypothetical protein [Desulfovibrio psychrotolerans]|uniref:Uncharacterized protein n=1 Tax=Desulfovibrio psychrotolerans TaxID=415242 RepID=A0A7J0BYA1_9BACT|nr:hypothetical protein [Desulfovibrio psychrotolerans]GFM38175.1 hypothetical protein DSM19430T_28590 [Desulfovibrio psychrotolerans]
MKTTRIYPANTVSGNAAQDRDSGNRAAAFRRAHRPGQVLRGRMLRFVRGTMAWVNVAGHELLAELHTRPEPGVPLHFLVEQTVPDILLRELDPEEARHYQAHPPRTPQDIARDYLTARDALDALLHQRLWPLAPAGDTPHAASASQSKADFSAFIAQDAEALAAFTLVQRHRLTVNRLLAERNSGELYHLPWLLPLARGVELLRAQGEHGVLRLTIGAVLPRLGRTLVQALAGSEKLAYRLFLEHAEASRPAGGQGNGAPQAHNLPSAQPPPDVRGATATQSPPEALCRQRDAAQTTRYPAVCLGSGPLPPGIHDILSGLLGPVSHGSLNIRA